MPQRSTVRRRFRAATNQTTAGSIWNRARLLNTKAYIGDRDEFGEITRTFEFRVPALRLLIASLLLYRPVPCHQSIMSSMNNASRKNGTARAISVHARYVKQKRTRHSANAAWKKWPKAAATFRSSRLNSTCRSVAEVIDTVAERRCRTTTRTITRSTPARCSSRRIRWPASRMHCRYGSTRTTTHWTAVARAPRWKRNASSILGRMFGWDSPLGHLTARGERWRILRHFGSPDDSIRANASSGRHRRTTPTCRISEVLGLEFSAIPVDNSGRMDVAAIENLLAQGDVGTVVATMGNTGLGAVDPLADILALRVQVRFQSSCRCGLRWLLRADHQGGR